MSKYVYKYYFKTRLFKILLYDTVSTLININNSGYTKISLQRNKKYKTNLGKVYCSLPSSLCILWSSYAYLVPDTKFQTTLRAALLKSLSRLTGPLLLTSPRISDTATGLRIRSSGCRESLIFCDRKSRRSIRSQSLFCKEQWEWINPVDL